jgi:ABC-type nitrate/sulfonate/bicarbonate transport system substrate-binding protein
MRSNLAILLVSLWFLSPTVAFGQKQNLTIAYASVGTSAVPIWIAQDKGFFEKNGIIPNLVYIGGGRVIIQAVASGNVSMAQIAGPALVNAKVSGLDLRMIAGIVNISSYSLFVRPEIKTIKDLKGKRLGLGTFGGSHDFILQYMLRHYGFEPQKEVFIVQMGIGADMDRFAAMQAGSVDGTLLNPPQTLLAAKAGYRALITPDSLPIPYQQQGIATTSEFLEKNRNVAKGVVKALAEAVHFYKTNKEESLSVISRRLRTSDRPALEETYRQFAQKLHPGKPYPTVEGMNFILDSVKGRFPQGLTVKVEDLIDTSLVKELDESGYIDQLYK